MSEAPQTITADKLCSLTGLTDRRHRQLASQGFFPPPIASAYQLAPTIQGMFRFYREHSMRAKGTLNDSKLGKTEAERQLAELALKKATREVLPTKGVERAWSFLLQGVRARWLQMPARSVLAFSLWTDARAAETWMEKEVESILADLAQNPDYTVPEETDDDAPAPQPDGSTS
jgi:hypothetical protein